MRSDVVRVLSATEARQGFHDRVLDGIRKFLEAHAMQGKTGAREFYEFEKTLHQRLLEAIAQGDFSREDVVARLGPATWAILPTDGGELAIEPGVALSLLWDNGECRPVEFWFDHRMRVSGSDGGRLCGAVQISRERYSCKRKDRERYCR